MSSDVAPGSILRFAQLSPGPWRNGAGTTREIARGGPGSPDWRLSLAEIERPGAFSRFPDTHRILTVIQGEEILLTLRGNEHRAGRGKPFHFAGDDPIQVRLPAGPVRALNVITRPGAVRAEVSVVELIDGQSHDLTADRFAVVLSGRTALRAGAGETPLLIHDTVRGGGHGMCAITGRGILAVVRLVALRVPGETGSTTPA